MIGNARKCDGLFGKTWDETSPLSHLNLRKFHA